MALSGKIIVISSTNANGATPLGINGRHRDLPHNKEVAVSDAELETLENSHVTFEVKGDAKAADLTEALDQGGGETGAEGTGQVPGADFLPHTEAEDSTLVLNPEPINQVPGGDNLTHGGAPDLDVEQARQDAADASAASEAGETEPAVVLANTDPDQIGLVARGEADAFDANAVLDQSIGKIAEGLDGLSDEQVAALIAAEKKGKNRTTLIDALERRGAAE